MEAFFGHLKVHEFCAMFAVSGSFMLSPELRDLRDFRELSKVHFLNVNRCLEVSNAAIGRSIALK